MEKNEKDHTQTVDYLNKEIEKWKNSYYSLIAKEHGEEEKQLQRSIRTGILGALIALLGFSFCSFKSCEATETGKLKFNNGREFGYNECVNDFGKKESFNKNLNKKKESK